MGKATDQAGAGDEGSHRVGGLLLEWSVPRHSCRPTAHSSHAGRIYNLGGKTHDMDMVQDFWCLDVGKLDQWRQLPSPPTKLAHTGIHVAVNKDVAYLFTGNPKIHAFDLVNKSWSLATTRLPKGTWPYPRHELWDYGSASAGGKLYVFGGQHETSAVGTNLLMCLDFGTKEWERLSGSVNADKADHDTPGPRRYPTTWADQDEGRIFVMYGEANRMEARIAKQKHGGMRGYGSVSTFLSQMLRRA
jgi:hypothetical protein